MNGAEEIVKFWLQSEGCFLMESLAVPRSRGKEIDFLAVKLRGNKLQKIHVEVQVSNNFVMPGMKLEKLAEEYHRKKFSDPRIVEHIIGIFGSTYERWEVRGKMTLGGTDIRTEYKKRRKEDNVEVIFFDQVLAKVVTALSTGTSLNPVIQGLQFTKFHNVVN